MKEGCVEIPYIYMHFITYVYAFYNTYVNRQPLKGCVCVRTYCINVCMHISHTGGSMVSENEDIVIECSVCMDDNKNYILIPCAHVCVCEVCAGKVTFYFHIGNQFIKTVKEEVQVLG